MGAFIMENQNKVLESSDIFQYMQHCMSTSLKSGIPLVLFVSVLSAAKIDRYYGFSVAFEISKSVVRIAYSTAHNRHNVKSVNKFK